MGTSGRMVRGGRRHVDRARGEVSRSGRPAQGRGIRFPAQSDGHGLGRRGLRSRLSPRSHRHGRKRRPADADAEPREMRPALGLRFVEGRRAERTRGIRLFRHRVPEPSRHAAAVPARRLGGVSPAQGLRSGAQSAAHDQRGVEGQRSEFRADLRRQFHPQAQRALRRGRIRHQRRSPAPCDARRAALQGFAGG